MTGEASTAGPDRFHERRRAVASAPDLREAEGPSIGWIAARLGRSPATVKEYYCDRTDQKSHTVKGLLRGGVPAAAVCVHKARDGQGDADAYCEACHPGTS